MMTYDQIERAYHYRRYCECLPSVGTIPRRQESTLDYVVCHGLAAGESSDDIRTDLSRHTNRTSEIDAALSNPLPTNIAATTVAQPDFVRSLISQSGDHRPLTDLTNLSPCAVPFGVRGQRRAIGELVCADWRWRNTTENPATIFAPLNQRTDDGLRTAHLRFTSVSFPFLPCLAQTALWIGLLTSKCCNIRVILQILNDRFRRVYLTGVLRLNERSCRVRGKQPNGQIVCEDPLTRDDFIFYLQQVSDLRSRLCSDADARYCCHPAGLDPLADILLPGNDGAGTSSTIVWADKPDFNNDMLF